MMQRYWRAWDIHRGATLIAIVTFAAILTSAIATVGPGLAQTTTVPPTTDEGNGRFDDAPELNGTWDTCRQPIEYRTDAVGADREFVDDAVERLADITGLTFATGPPLAALPATPQDGIFIGFTGGTHPIFDTETDAVGIARTVIKNGHITGAVVAVRSDRELTDGFGPGPTQGNVLLHELGHALGLPHTTNPESLMYPQTNDRQGDGFAPEDILALQEATRVPTTCP